MGSMATETKWPNHSNQKLMSHVSFLRSTHRKTRFTWSTPSGGGHVNPTQGWLLPFTTGVFPKFTALTGSETHIQKEAFLWQDLCFVLQMCLRSCQRSEFRENSTMNKAVLPSGHGHFRYMGKAILPQLCSQLCLVIALEPALPQRHPGTPGHPVHPGWSTHQPRVSSPVWPARRRPTGTGIPGSLQ